MLYNHYGAPLSHGCPTEELRKFYDALGEADVTWLKDMHISLTCRQLCTADCRWRITVQQLTEGAEEKEEQDGP